MKNVRLRTFFPDFALLVEGAKKIKNPSSRDERSKAIIAV